MEKRWVSRLEPTFEKPLFTGDFEVSSCVILDDFMWCVKSGGRIERNRVSAPQYEYIFWEGNEVRLTFRYKINLLLKCCESIYLANCT